MDRSDASALADLQMHWDEAYAIGLDGDIWSATFHGSAEELRAHTSTELRELIRADYAYRQQVSRVRAAATGTEAADDALDDDAPDDDAPDDASGRSGQAGGAGHEDGRRGTGIPGLDNDDLDDADFDDDDYAAHFDGARVGATGGGHRDDTEPGRQAGLGRASLPDSGYANLRGERMST